VCVCMCVDGNCVPHSRTRGKGSWGSEGREAGRRRHQCVSCHSQPSVYLLGPGWCLVGQGTQMEGGRQEKERTIDRKKYTNKIPGKNKHYKENGSCRWHHKWLEGSCWARVAPINRGSALTPSGGGPAAGEFIRCIYSCETVCECLAITQRRRLYFAFYF